VFSDAHSRAKSKVSNVAVATASQKQYNICVEFDVLDDVVWMERVAYLYNMYV
jgi:hypothetical protein